MGGQGNRDVGAKNTAVTLLGFKGLAALLTFIKPLAGLLDQNYDNHSVSELMQMTYTDLLPENTFLPIQQTNRTKEKYQCPHYHNRVWGKPEMNLICGDCNSPFRVTM